MWNKIKTVVSVSLLSLIIFVAGHLKATDYNESKMVNLGLIAKEKQVVKELMPMSLKVGHQLDVYKDLGLDSQNTQIVIYEPREINNGKNIITFYFNDDSSLNTVIYGSETFNNGLAYFNDLNLWSTSYIMEMYNRGYLRSVNDTNFGGLNTVTFDEVATSLNKILLNNDIILKYTNYRSTFSDRIRYVDINYADIGNMAGVLIDRVDSYKNYKGSLYGFNMTKLDLADTLVTVLNQLNTPIYNDNGLYINDMKKYGDGWNSIAKKVINYGLMSLDSSNNFYPEKEVTKEELAVILYRFDNLIKNSEVR